MTERQSQLLQLIVESYTKTSVPVGSKFLVEEGSLNVSGATLRNEMRELEENGFLTHPHTSAGRIPTESGYRYYVDNLLQATEPKKKEREEIDMLGGSPLEARDKVKQIAKVAAGQVHNAVIVSFGGKSLYYTGISKLFGQSEFQDYARTVEISAIFDQCEDRIGDVHDRVSSDTPSVLIGKENPLGSACSVVAQRLNNKDLFLVLGPMRMEYGRTVGMVQYITSVIR